MQTIKSIARGRWPSTTSETPRFSWYEPLTDPEAIERAVRYVLAEPDLFLNTTSDARLHGALYTAAERFATDNAAPNRDAMEADTMQFGVTPLFDGAELEPHLTSRRQHGRPPHRWSSSPEGFVRRRKIAIGCSNSLGR